MQQETISKKKRILTMLIAALFIVSTVFSVVCVIKRANHKCNRADCQICQSMQNCIKRLTDLGSNSDDEVSANATLYFTLLVVSFVCLTFSRKTLIDLKTKLSN